MGQVRRRSPDLACTTTPSWSDLVPHARAARDLRLAVRPSEPAVRFATATWITYYCALPDDIGWAIDDDDAAAFVRLRPPRFLADWYLRRRGRVFPTASLPGTGVSPDGRLAHRDRRLPGRAWGVTDETPSTRPTLCCGARSGSMPCAWPAIVYGWAACRPVER